MNPGDICYIRVRVKELGRWPDGSPRAACVPADLVDGRVVDRDSPVLYFAPDELTPARTIVERVRQSLARTKDGA